MSRASAERERKLKRQIEEARKSVLAAIAEPTGKYGRGLAMEGYAGGYLAALDDVTAAIGGWPPSNSRYWPRQARAADDRSRLM